MTPLFYRFLFGVFSIFSGVAAQDLDDFQIREAYQGNEYDSARALYELLLEQTSNPVEKQQIIYNIGSIFLAEGDSQSALEYFNSIVLNENSSPLLVRRVGFNTALAISQNVQIDIDSLEKNDWVYPEKISYATEQLNQAFHLLAKTEDADCQIEMLLKKSKCETAKDVKLLKQKIEDQLIILQHLSENNTLPAVPTLAIPPVISLRNMFDMQKQAFKETGSALTASTPISEEQQATLLVLQELVLDKQKLFFQDIIAWENIQFNDKFECQKEPWNTILALYYTGYHAASLAKADLSKDQEYWHLAIKQQLFALKQWQKTLEALESYFSKPRSSNQPENKINNTPQTRIENTIKLIEKMQNADDESTLIPSELPQSGDAPW